MKIFPWVRKNIIATIIGILTTVIVGSLFLETSETTPVLYATQNTTIQVTEGRVLLVREKMKMLKQ